MLSISEPGDTACFYYAGHGGLHPLSDNTYYQTIIPYSGRFITDWDLWAVAEQLPQSTINFTVILDSCHSGGMHEESEHPAPVRTIRLAREMIERLTQFMKNLVPFGVTVPNAEVYRNNVRNVRPAADAGVCYEEDPNQQFIPQAKSTLLTACRWDEFAGETSNHGYFTQAILDTVNQSNFLMGHRKFHQQLLDRTQQLSSNSQTPQLRGQTNRMEEDFLQGWRASL
jgi:hypothetical protein